MDIVEHGAVVILALVLYAVVDKALVPLIKGKRDANGLSGDAQRFIVDDHKRRLERVEEDLRAVRDTVAILGTQSEVSQAILGRIEKQIGELEDGIG